MKILIKEEQLKKIINEELFLFNNLSEDEKEHIYDMFRDSYVRATGNSWVKNKFYSKANDFLFFGNKNEGFITVRPNPDGTLKLTTSAGNIKNIFDGVSELISTNKPIWGLMSSKMSMVLSKKYGFIIPPKEVSGFLIKAVVDPNSSYNLNDDGTITFNYTDIKSSSKSFIANEKFYKFIFDKLEPDEVPYHIMYFLKSILHEDINK